MPAEQLLPADGPDRPRSLAFSTEGVAAANRLELWSAYNARALIDLDIRTMDDSPLAATEVNLHFAAVRLARVRGSAQVIERSESYIRKHPMDLIGVFFALKGEAFFYYPGGFEALRPGQAVIYDADQPFMRGFHRGVEEMVLTVPRGTYLGLSGGRPLRRPVVVDFHEPGPANRHMRALARLVHGALAACDRDGADGQRPGAATDGVEHSSIELLRLLLAGRGGGAAEAYLAAARCFIGDHLADPGLCPAQIAAAVGISERHLARVFTEAGEPPGAYVLRRRLERAAALLADPGEGTTPIAAIAARCGFSSQAYFARAFRARFGTTPREARRDRGAAVPVRPA
ncbi:AraC family transcriptional regulator [Sinomonas atrocyanea]|uniref:AraC family transcriptional regulator n=1 Tax=Sinomonas atrocyanea TaxID=37927 RepID=A0A127A4H5_9MICC|nr:AraC family transcriptional regulator [Sinomonas atrocyanea]AMM34370.1 AraC family transcriptional regulator [Sinomonas atrocyanea]GEB64548.1 AraC family transcriptional regulator [Sinomonas atrocyanea]